jgi:large subunit ribosomal protein L10
MRAEKIDVVADIAAGLKASPFAFVVDYKGLTVQGFSELRKRLAAAGARCHVVKNTFLRRAVSDAGLPELPELKGQTAIVVGDKDAAAAAKILKTFAGEFQKPAVRGGFLDALPATAEQIGVIADLPSREVLLSQLLGVMMAPATKLVRTLNEPASGLARVLKAKADKEGQAAA